MTGQNAQRGLLRAAKRVLKAVDNNLDHGRYPYKWHCPWKELTALRNEIHKMETQP